MQTLHLVKCKTVSSSQGYSDSLGLTINTSLFFFKEIFRQSVKSCLKSSVDRCQSNNIWYFNIFSSKKHILHLRFDAFINRFTVWKCFFKEKLDGFSHRDRIVPFLDSIVWKVKIAMWIENMCFLSSFINPLQGKMQVSVSKNIYQH